MWGRREKLFEDKEKLDKYIESVMGIRKRSAFHIRIREHRIQDSQKTVYGVIIFPRYRRVNFSHRDLEMRRRIRKLEIAIQRIQHHLKIHTKRTHSANQRRAITRGNPR